MSKQRILLNHQSHLLNFLLTSPAGQEALRTAYEDGVVPKCQCKASGVEMYISRRGNTYYLAKLPDSGFLHANDCPSGCAGGVISGLETYGHGALVYRDLKYRVFYTETRSFIDRLPTSCTIDGLLDLLIELAGMNTKYPNETSTWGTYFQKMREAAASIEVNGESLADRLFVPQSFDTESADEINAEIARRLDPASQVRWVCAPMKAVLSSKYGWLIKLKHLGRHFFWVSSQASRLSTVRSTNPIDMSAPPEHAMCLLGIKPGRDPFNFNVTEFAIRPTDASLFPSSDRLNGLLNFLLGQRHPVIRPLRYDAYPEHVMADFGLIQDNAVIPAFRLTKEDPNNSDRRRLAYLIQRNADVFISEC